jgi:hypothetical protein
MTKDSGKSAKPDNSEGFLLTSSMRRRYNVGSTTAMSPIFPERKQHENV